MKWSENKTEYRVGIWSMIIFLAFWLIGVIFNQPVFPLGYLGKIAFAGIAVSTFWILTWFMMEKSKPVLKEIIDPDTILKYLTQCTPFQKLILGFLFFALIFWGFIYTASHL